MRKSRPGQHLRASHFTRGLSCRRVFPQYFQSLEKLEALIEIRRRSATIRGVLQKRKIQECELHLLGKKTQENLADKKSRETDKEIMGEKNSPIKKGPGNKPPLNSVLGTAPTRRGYAWTNLTHGAPLLCGWPCSSGRVLGIRAQERETRRHHFRTKTSSTPAINSSSLSQHGRVNASNNK